MVSHIVGAALGVVALVLCVVFSAISGSPWAVVSSCIYGASLILLYTISSIYHGLRRSTGKKVFQILDHCTIYFLIAGSYMPVVLCAIREVSPVRAWILFGIIWGLVALATTLTAVDLKKYSKFSMACYIGIGWSIILAVDIFLTAVPLPGILLLLFGGIAYTLGAVIYGIGKKTQKRYVHSIFHLFVILGSVLQFFSILLYIL
ncbi:hemolysin III family protein [Methanocorpusculaceae archaeon]|nr:hemolysin III family protein [Methanocorpusculaceae archaeon]MBO5118454.1 hemolysin III family protein [Methanocorpusculum sp.]MBO5367709.1 hemolysin III family protein [Methanocorpusculum sp.]MBO5430702.1 hemolysin III family protein [Methanocorpusculum sp.]MBP3444108.1 hemolysin III family protein [Methanocorpusculaceae archaeon]